MQLELNAGPWRVFNDTVMGGVSSSEVTTLETGLVFHGRLSLDNNGGFASIRRRFTESFAAVTGFRLTVRGDGRPYQFRLRADDSFDGIAWRAVLNTDGSAQRIDFSTADFEPVIRGRRQTRAGALNTADIHWLGFMLADKHPGPFRLEVHAIETLMPCGEDRGVM